MVSYTESSELGCNSLSIFASILAKSDSESDFKTNKSAKLVIKAVVVKFFYCCLKVKIHVYR